MLDIRVEYDNLEVVELVANNQCEEITRLHERLTAHMNMLQGGAWEGSGAQAFYLEMEDEVKPALDRLALALEQTEYTFRAIITTPSGKMPKRTARAYSACSNSVFYQAETPLPASSTGC